MGPLINLARRVKYRLEGRYHSVIQHRYEVEFVGIEYGGYSICPIPLPPEPIVYSFGIGQDISFDRGMIQKYNTPDFAFVPTVKSHAWLQTQQLLANFRWFDYGIGVQDGVLIFSPPKNPAFVSHSIVQNPHVQAEGSPCR